MSPRPAGPGSILLLVALCCGVGEAPAAGATEREAVVYWVQHRSADELLPLALTALAGEGAASVDRGTNTIVLVGPKPPVEAAVELLRQQDRRLRSVVLRYESKRLDELDSHGIQVDWSVSAGDLRVGNVRFPRGREGVRVTGHALRSQRQGGLTGMLRVLEGQSGRIHTGEVVPVRSRSRWHSETHFVEAASGFEASPRILGDGRVRVELLPVEASVDRRGHVAYTEAATTVTLLPGETVAVGGLSRTTDQHQRGTRILDAGRRARTERVLLLSVEVEGDPATKP